MPRAAKNPKEPPIPDISEEFNVYCELNPEYELPMSKRAGKEFLKNGYDKNGKELPQKKIIENINVLRVRLGAIIPQLQDNQAWMEKLKLSQSGSPAKTPVACSDAEFKAATATFEKRMQQKYSAATERIIFDRQVGEDGKWDMSHVTIDPERITNTDLENFGLEAYKPRKGARRLERITAYANAVPAIKEMLGDLKPMVIMTDYEMDNIKEFRLMRIGKGANEGQVLATSWDSNDELHFAKTSLHGADRRIAHMRKSYRREFEILAELERMVRLVDAKINKPWDQAKAELPRIMEYFGRLFVQLKYVKDKEKLKILAKIGKILNIDNILTAPEQVVTDRDKTHRVVRPAITYLSLKKGALRAIWNSIKVNVRKRKQAVEKKLAPLGKDRAKLHDYILKQQAPFKDLHKTISDVEIPAAAGKGPGLHILRVNDPLSEEVKKRILENLRLFAAQFDVAKNENEPYWFEPYQTMAKLLVQHIGETSRKVDALPAVTKAAPGKESNVEQRVDAAKEFINIYLVTKIEDFYEQFQDVYERYISLPQYRDLNATNQALEKLKVLLKVKPVSPAIENNDYYRVFSELYHLVNSLQKWCREAMSLEKDATIDKKTLAAEQKKIIGAMKKRVRGFRLDILLKTKGEKYEAEK